MCVASAALPPLPKISSLPPVRRELVAIAARRIASSVIGPSSSRCLASMLSWMRERTSTSTGCSERTCSVVNRLSIDPPRRQALVHELELRHLDPHAGQRGGDTMLLLERAEEEHVAAPAGAGDLPPERALTAGRFVGLVDVLVGDPGRHLLLVRPRGAEQLAELRQTPSQ